MKKFTSKTKITRNDHEIEYTTEWWGSLDCRDPRKEASVDCLFCSEKLDLGVCNNLSCELKR